MSDSILVVDNQPDSLRLIVETLRKEGFDVRPANSSELALASIAVKPADLVLLDVDMPGIDGFEVCRRLKADAKTEDTPVMFISSANAIEEHVECFRVGGVAFVNKPIVREELVARLRAHVELARLRKGLEAEVTERTRALQSAYEQLQRELRDHEHAERALRESEQRFRNMADTAPVLIWVAGADSLVTFLNKGWLHFRGRAMGDELGNGWVEGVHPDDLEACLSTYRSSFDERRKFEMEYRLRRWDGEYRWILDTGVPHFTSAGEFAGYIGSCADVTDFKHSQEQKLTVQKMESLGSLAAGVAHDFNNFLGSILAESDIALSELAPDSESRSHIERISTVAVRASETVELLMMYAGANEPPRLKQVNLTDLIEEVLALVGPSLSKNAVVSKTFAADLPPVLSHAPQLRRVAINLLKNASEALNGGAGSITVTTALEQVPKEFVRSFEGGEYVRLTIADTGLGMTDEALARAFDPFYSTKFLGRGLGLAVVQGIVRSHGGFIRVESEPGAGTTFHLLLRAASDLNSSSKGTDTLRKPKQSPNYGCILVVEDEPTLRNAAARALEKQGFKVLLAADGQSALKLFAENPIDAVLLNLNLPDISGRELQEQMRRLRPDVRVLLTSGYGIQSTHNALIDGSTRSRFIQKPYRVAELVRSLKELLQA